MPESLAGKVTVIEIDFYEVVGKKLTIIKQNDKMMGLIPLPSEAELPIFHDKHINSH